MQAARYRCVSFLTAVLGLAVAFFVHNASLKVRADAQPKPDGSVSGHTMNTTVRIVAHRGLLRHSPENTLSNFRACRDLRLGFEVDVRRSKDGVLVCVHDDTLDRTTNGSGPIADRSIAELRELDAGSWFAPQFAGERIPTLEEILALVADSHGNELIAIDLKAADVEADMVRLAQQAGVLDRLLFIGTTIRDRQVREKLRAASPMTHTACVVEAPAELDAALTDPVSDWVYFRYIPSPDDIAKARAAKRLSFIAGPTVAGLEADNWNLAIDAGIDAILTDYPLALAEQLRQRAASANTSNTEDGRTMTQRFDELAASYIDEYPALAPVAATGLGDHRFDAQLDQVGQGAIQHERAFIDRYQQALNAIERSQLSRSQAVDYQLLQHELKKWRWQLDELQEWKWNPLVYTQLAGGAIYSLMARDFAPVEQRLVHVADRLEQLPRMLAQVRETLEPALVPSVHAETAVKQNRGVLSILDNMVRPELDRLPEADRQRLNAAMALATAAVEEHGQWLKDTLVPAAAGDFRLGPQKYDAKLSLTLGASLTRQQVRDRAESELRRARAEMYAIARPVYLEKHPDGEAPESPTPEQQQTVIEACLEMAYAEVPPRDGIVAAARESMDITTDFVLEHDLMSIPPDPLEIILMPEFQRGVSVAYCDSPGPLEVGQKTFYAVAPLPEDWSDEQCASFLREYNIRSVHNLTVHEAMPGHFTQLAHANRYPGRLRALLASGVFIEGWACYTEQMLSQQGFLNGDPLMKLITLKWYLRTIANALIDQAIHVDGMRREDAMHLMMHDTFQEEREAAGKWTRAQLTSAQLATYFVGVQEHLDMRRHVEEAWGSEFSLKKYHDTAVSFGSPPVRFVQALMLDEPIPE